MQFSEIVISYGVFAIMTFLATIGLILLSLHVRYHIVTWRRRSRLKRLHDTVTTRAKPPHSAVDLDKLGMEFSVPQRHFVE